MFTPANPFAMKKRKSSLSPISASGIRLAHPEI
jgi:hypothetical protein